MWTKPAAFGGLVGGEFGGTDTSNFYAPQQYQPKFLTNNHEWHLVL